MNSPEEPISERDQLLVFFLQYLLATGAIVDKCFTTEGNQRALACAMYTGAILKDAKSILLLIENGCSFSVPKILRTIIESVANIKCIIEDDTYVDYLVFESMYNKRKDAVRFKELAKMKRFKNRISVEKECLDLWERALANYAQWESPYTIERKFQIAKTQDVYDTAYSFLSEDVHARLISLMSYFHCEGGQAAAVSKGNDCDDETLAVWVEVVTLSMVESVDCLCKACGVDPGEDLKTLQWNIIQMQKKRYPDFCPEHYKEYPE
jgi:hypothetical protein